jgi:hypothetical protein
MGKKSGPATPDYTGAANAQAQASQDNTTAQTWANRPDQTSPFGNMTWQAQTVKDPTTGKDVTKWTQNTTLDPKIQGALDSQLGVQQGRSDLAAGMMPGVSNTLGQPLDYSGFQQLSQGPNAGNFSTTPGQVQGSLDFSGAQGIGDSGAQRQRAEQAAYASQTANLDPQFASQQRAMETDLANRGISRNSAAYSRAMDDFGRNKQNAYSQANLNAINAGGTEAQRNYGMDMGLRQQQVGEIGQQGNFANSAQGMMFGQNQSANAQNYSQQMQSANYQNQLRQQQIAEAQQQRGQGLNEMNALLGGQQVTNPQFQNFGQSGAAQSPDYVSAMNAQYQGSLNSQSNKNAMFGDILGGVSQGLGMYFSDRRVKRDVRRIGTHPRGFGIYRYCYIGERGERVGVMAQDVRRFVPEAVRDLGGVLAVNYAMLEAA